MDEKSFRHHFRKPISIPWRYDKYEDVEEQMQEKEYPEENDFPVPAPATQRNEGYQRQKPEDAPPVHVEEGFGELDCYPVDP